MGATPVRAAISLARMARCRSTEPVTSGWLGIGSRCFSWAAASTSWRRRRIRSVSRTCSGDGAGDAGGWVNLVRFRQPAGGTGEVPHRAQIDPAERDGLNRQIACQPSGITTGRLTNDVWLPSRRTRRTSVAMRSRHLASAIPWAHQERRHRDGAGGRCRHSLTAGR
jgi:hypothetical protein